MLDGLQFTDLLLNLQGFYFKPNRLPKSRAGVYRGGKVDRKLRCGIDAAKKGGYYTALT
jgi:hypothetical protein